MLKKLTLKISNIRNLILIIIDYKLLFLTNIKYYSLKKKKFYKYICCYSVSPYTSFCTSNITVDYQLFSLLS